MQRKMTGANNNNTILLPGQQEEKENGNHQLALIPYVSAARFTHHFLLESFGRQKENIMANVIISNDVIPNILSYCDAPTLAKCACVCREWRYFCASDELWENLCRTKFGVSATQMKPSPDPVKILYIVSHQRMRQIVCSFNSHASLKSLQSIPSVIPMSRSSMLF